MPSVIVIYDSQTGNTEKMAEAVGEGATSVEGVEVELLKVGTPFRISKLSLADAIIIGSPAIYGSISPRMRGFLDSVREQVEAGRLKLAGKVGGAFGSYGWDGIWIAETLCSYLASLGFKVEEYPISAVDFRGEGGLQIHEESLQRCYNLGKTIAKKISD